MDTMTMVDNRIKELGDLYKRMDKTREQLYIDEYPYTLKDFNGENKVPNTISVTSNMPPVTAFTITSDLMGAHYQTVVEGDITGRQAHKIEEFIDDNFAQADEFLLRKFAMAGLWPWLCNHVCIRGIIGCRWITTVSGDRYSVDVLPIDMRWTPFVIGKWVAAITFRTSEEVQEEYPDAYVRSHIADIEVRDFWDGEKNEVWIDNNLAKKRRHELGALPFVIAIPPTGFMLRDKGYMKHEAEDIFFLNRGLYDEINRALSVEQSIGMDVLLPPMEQEVEVVDNSPAQLPPVSGETLKVKKGERHVPVPRGDLNRASLTARADINKLVSYGGTVDVDLGISGGSPPPSALLITTESEIRGKFLNPRLATLKIFREQLSRMMIAQYIKMGKGKTSLSVGLTGKKRRYSVADMHDPESYFITCQIMSKSKRQEIANLAMANAAKTLLPLKVILKDILLVDDPDGVIRELEMEQARRADPALALFDMAVRYAEEAEDIADEMEADVKRLQSRMLTKQCVAIIRQRGLPPATDGQPAKAPQALLPEVKGNAQPLMALPQLMGAAGGVNLKRSEAPEDNI